MSNGKKAMEQLFVSRVRIKLLHYYFTHPDTPVHLRGAVRELKEEINAVRRELNRMEEIQLLRIDQRGNRKYYTLNKEGPFIEELRGIVFKAFGLGGEILKNQKKIGTIKFAILTSSYVTGIPVGNQNVDLILIGDINLTELNAIISEFEKKEEREVNYTVLKPTEFELRKKRRDPFVTELLLSTKLMVVGSQEELVS